MSSPCPFCGSIPVVHASLLVHRPSESFTCECNADGCPQSPSAYGADAAAASADWERLHADNFGIAPDGTLKPEARQKIYDHFATLRAATGGV